MDCRNCEHHKRLVGDTHISCHHPMMESITSNSMSGLLQIKGFGFPLVPDVEINGKIYPVVVLNPHGVKHGWANWPFNFDPVWVDICVLKLIDETFEAVSNKTDNQRSE